MTEEKMKKGGTLSCVKHDRPKLISHHQATSTIIYIVVRGTRPSLSGQRRGGDNAAERASRWGSSSLSDST
jgi:hypothetical protein